MTKCNSVSLVQQNYPNNIRMKIQMKYSTPSFRGVPNVVNNPTAKRGLLASVIALCTGLFVTKKTAENSSEDIKTVHFTHYDNVAGDYTKTILKDESYKIVDNNTKKILEECDSDGTRKMYLTTYLNTKGDYTEIWTKNINYKIIDNSTGEILEHGEEKSPGIIIAYRKDGSTVEQNFWHRSKKITLKDGTYKIISDIDSKIEEEYFSDGTTINYFDNFVKTTLKDGSYKIVKKEDGKVLEERLVDGTIIKNKKEFGRDYTETVYSDGSYKIFNNKTNKIEKEFANGRKITYQPNGSRTECIKEGGYFHITDYDENGEIKNTYKTPAKKKIIYKRISYESHPEYYRVGLLSNLYTRTERNEEIIYKEEVDKYDEYDKDEETKFIK